MFILFRRFIVLCPEEGLDWSDLTVKVTLLSHYLGDTPGFDLAWGASERVTDLRWKLMDRSG